jgi:hypothetical protein
LSLVYDWSRDCPFLRKFLLWIECSCCTSVETRIISVLYSWALLYWKFLCK